MRSILLVDGDHNFRRALAIALRLEGFAVEEAGSLLEARRRLGPHVDAAVVDLLLPGGDGLELAESIRDGEPGTFLVVVSAHPEAFAAARARVPTAVALEKPFRVDGLLSMLAAKAPASKALAASDRKLA